MIQSYKCWIRLSRCQSNSLFLKDTKRARYTYATDEEALDAHVMVTKFEKLNPSLEPSHAFAEAIKLHQS